MFDTTIKFDEYFSKRWPTKVGLLIGSFVLLSSFLYLEKLFIDVTKCNIPLYVNCLAVLLLLSIHFYLWAIKSGRVILRFINRIRIAIQPDLLADENNLKNILQIMLKRHRLGYLFNIIVLPSDQEIHHASIAERYLSSRGIDLLIWGNSVLAREEGREVRQYFIWFSYSFRNPSIKSLLIKDFGEAIKERYWKVNRENSLSEIGILAENISDICLYIIAICLLTRGRVNYGMRLLEDLYTQICSNPKKKFLQICPRLKNHLISLYNLLANKAWREEKDRKKAALLSQKTLSLDENNYDCHARLALIEYLNGNIISSRRHVKRCRNIDPRNPCTLFDQAFYYILDKKYDKAMARYRRLEHLLVDGLMAFEVAVFLEEEFRQNRKEIGFLFAAGFVNYRFVVHKEIGLEQLRRFLKLAKGKAEYEDFYNKANAMIDSVNNKAGEDY